MTVGGQILEEVVRVGQLPVGRDDHSQPDVRPGGRRDGSSDEVRGEGKLVRYALRHPYLAV